MRVESKVASITLSSTLWRSSIISVRATLCRITTASAWQWGCRRATDGCDRDEWRPGGWDQASPVRTCSLSGVSSTRPGNTAGDADAAVEACKQNQESKSFWRIPPGCIILCFVPLGAPVLEINSLLKLRVLWFVMSQRDTHPRSYRKVKQSLYFCIKQTFNI